MYFAILRVVAEEAMFQSHCDHLRSDIINAGPRNTEYLEEVRVPRIFKGAVVVCRIIVGPTSNQFGEEGSHLGTRHYLRGGLVLA
jgi:hypothetical protein